MAIFLTSYVVICFSTLSLSLCPSLSLSQEEEVCLYKCIQPPQFKTIPLPTQEENPTLHKWWKVYGVSYFGTRR